ncbi:hypothetical protein BAUCODRAFT_151069 [Baudoinia panamericana UAMH 10762]|uniref:Uncharacterized protein n=1 Tax=Baudoinia panamericana (strain UAMH 10762) TaxID=717646 RepID=M2N152_BAUPA|nr:uncharacterized protein BAUCODRAFT_151069 [Baudoinia panamericana UAMH 10762]EMC92654.1 hypothetical protein BAUCODRAFT_151069 [Baudoinia panamericana UAMH 10762]
MANNYDARVPSAYEQEAGIDYPKPTLSKHHSPASSILSSDARNGKHGVMAKYLYKQVANNQWFEPMEDDIGNKVHSLNVDRGVVIQRDDGAYLTYPPQLNEQVLEAVLRLDVPIAFTMSSEVTHTLLRQTTPEQTQVGDPRSGVTLPVVDSVESLASGRVQVPREGFICLCRKEQFVLVWGSTVESILVQGNDIETWLVGLVWGSQAPVVASPPRVASPFSQRSLNVSPPPPQPYPTPIPGFTPSPTGFRASSTGTPEWNEKYDVIRTAIAREEMGDKAYDPERDGKEAPKRPLVLVHALCIGLAMVLVVVVEMACIAKLLTEARLDGSYMRFALLVTVPIFACFSLFFMIVITGSLFQLFGPLSAVQENSMFYSAKAPKPDRYKDYELPHVTIQMPVYKEGLKGVIMPTIESCMAAVRFYEARGGTASIFVNDDGMQLVKPELAEARQAYYELHNIGWCSRPPHCTQEGPKHFLRKGKFKKASNMNYCLDFAGRVEDDWLARIEAECEKRGCTQDQLTIQEEEELYDQAREAQLEKDGGRTWAAGNVRMGEVILIIDSDTRVPEDCLLYGALEMHESPEVALLQHSSGILQVVNNVFENGITYFTNLIYTSIQFAVGSGDCAPFVGHNTFIRWKAIQSVSWEEDGMTKFWSDSHVSEDFDVSLRLQIAGFVVRLATYHNGGFKEGVSLTVYDELARWEKYAYGCNELVFHPLRYWPTRGPITPLFWKFLRSNIKPTSKMTIIAYIFTYYAIASAIPLTLANYLIVGLFTDNIDQFYITSWKIFVGMAAVFNVLSPLAYAMLRHRLGQKTFFLCLWETIKWTPMFLLFFGGISFHLLQALLCHAFSINMEWTTTAKELEASGFRIGLDRIVRDFKWMYAFMLPLCAGMIYLATAAPRGWSITDFAAIVPLANQVGCHALLPFALGLF